MALLFQLTQKLSQGFASFWTRWPRKVAKVEAQKAWNQVVTPEDEDAIHEALEWQVPIFQQREPEHIPHAATWIRGRRWEDERPAPKKAPMPTNVRPLTTAQTQQQDAVSRIQTRIRGGMDPEQAKQEVYRELGWVK